MKINVFLIVAMTFIAQACSNATASGPFGESTDRCKGWSSLRCEGIPSKATLNELAAKTKGMKYRGQLAASIDKITLADFLGRHKKDFKRIKYLNGWDENVALDTAIEISDSNTIWIATGGFLPEEFSKQERKYSFAEDDCAEQIRGGKRNYYKCHLGTSYSVTAKEFLRIMRINITLEEFVKMNNLPSASSRIVANRYYKVGKWN